MKPHGQIAMEAYYRAAKTDGTWEDQAYKNGWEAAAQAVLASLWRPVSEPIPPAPRRPVLYTDGGHLMSWSREYDVTHWMPIPPLPTPPEPTPEEKERVEFEAWYSSESRSNYPNLCEQTARLAWQAARVSKERAKP